MKWQIPAKTFLLGEYAALAGGSAILLTTKPYFELSLTETPDLDGIHPESPAGILWQKNHHPERGLSWFDPYKNCGGLGASSAQFLGSYLAQCSLNQTKPKLNDMLTSYYETSWSGSGLRPSGYDVIAQSQQACVYINQQNRTVKSYHWPFKDLSFFLIHTGMKLATHQHLKEATIPSEIGQLSFIVDQAKEAFEQQDSEQLIDSVNHYHKKLSELNRVAHHSQLLISQLAIYPEVLAIKGCGALGADILLLITARKHALTLRHQFQSQNYLLLATEEELTTENGLLLKDEAIK
jgi:mevalonate kinase